MIRLAHIDDLNDIMNIIKEAQLRMKQAHMTQWQNNYPNPEVILKDILDKSLYVYVQDGLIIGTMSVFSYDVVYDNIEGTWLNQNPYMVIHRIALASSTLGQNKTKEMIDFVFNHFKTKDIRIDTHPKNTPMIKSLERQGFVYCGIVYVITDKDALRLAYHKHII